MTRMKIRDADLRQAVTEDGIRPGDPSWSALTELQHRRDAEKGWAPRPIGDKGADSAASAGEKGPDAG